MFNFQLTGDDIWVDTSFVFKISRQTPNNLISTYEKYHCCDLRNRNGTCQQICYKIGESYISGTNEQCWRTTRSKYLTKKVYFTHQYSKALTKILTTDQIVANSLQKIKDCFTKDLLKLGFYNT